MAQPEAAAGGEPVASEPANTDPIEALAEAWEDEAPQDEPESEPVPQEEGELTEDDPEDEAELPPIDPPVSWAAEAKETFKNLPREAQEVVAQRETERERFVQTKAQEAARAKEDARREALQQVVEIDTQAVQKLQQLQQSILPQKPDPRYLQGSDQDRAYFYQQQGLYETAIAQQQSLQREAEQHAARAQAAQQELQQAERAEFHRVLGEQFPEYLAPETHAQHAAALASIARDLGYSNDLIASAGASDILAMRKAAEWKAKADRLDALNAKKMEGVRAAKGLPKVTRPGVPRSKAESTAASRAAAWDRVRANRTDYDAFADAIGLK